MTYMYTRAAGGRMYHIKDEEIPSRSGPSLCGFEPGAQRPKGPSNVHPRAGWGAFRLLTDPPRLTPVCPKCQKVYHAPA